MSAHLIDGKALSQKILDSVKHEIESLSRSGKPVPGLAVILVGDDPASKIYVRNKERACQATGIKSNVITLDERTTEEELLSIIDTLNKDDGIHGILVQLPLPSHINESKVIEAISPYKDVDGFHPINRGRLLTGEDCLEPCTPKGIIHLIQSTGIDITGKHAVVIGRSNNVGKPAGLMLLRNNATVTIAHTKTQDLPSVSRTADILVVAAGRPRLVDETFIKEGAVVIDVGISRVDGKITGDVDFDKVKEKAGYITPVPGGVGPMTVATLMENTLKAAKRAICKTS
ncbi:MAG TPA: bifunctional methylenetetrahydrofolate dehydrogenase/methenyltetrahydrofolate cyclohydrolase FolD [Candidatus Atribacteria bacterium]|nr:bifunctional methylenetetrahydrofolate dehydrogenase/methenyltetrahydrofolate cyclohydrolase FolD [Candidatus Atribacteria bacterium]HPT77888.1 bifunctional methylenetetrahydrofolate dehydrogenase/methenyltetrahydrofolate cyclohydrolase FolD [Candidatus Atribacteria bacterium]